MRKLSTFLLVSLLAGGCTIGPDYQRPVVDTPTEWRVMTPDAKELADTAWWQQFNDPVLNDLIGVALSDNKDLLIAVARIEEYAGRYGVVRADLFPQLGASTDYSRGRITEAGANPLSPAYKTTTDSFSATLNTSWELDLWGRVRRSTEAAKAQFIASEEGRRGVILSLVGNVASAYINLRALDRQLEISRNTVCWRGHLRTRIKPEPFPV